MSTTQSDAELRAHSLLMWANHIETGNVTLSRTDLRQMGLGDGAKSLGPDQLELVVRLRALAQEERSS